MSDNTAPIKSLDRKRRFSVGFIILGVGGMVCGLVHHMIQMYTLTNGSAEIYIYFIPHGDRLELFAGILVVWCLCVLLPSRFLALAFSLIAFWTTLFIPEHVPLGSWGHYTDFHSIGRYKVLPIIGDGLYVASTLLLLLAGIALLRFRRRERLRLVSHQQTGDG